MSFELFVLVLVSVLLSFFFLAKYAVLSFENHLGLVPFSDKQQINLNFSSVNVSSQEVSLGRSASDGYWPAK